MTVHSAGSSSYPRQLAAPHAQRGRHDRTLGGWARNRPASRAVRRVLAIRHRAAHRVKQQLGAAWHVVHPPRDDPPSEDDHAGFIAVGPAGVFAVSVVDRGRQRVMIAGDVIQIQGRRPPYVAQARRYARRTRKALSAVVGTRVPVVPVLTFAGSGAIIAHGLPSGCLTVSLRELSRVLAAAGDKISPDTARKLADVAGHPSTWEEP